MGRSPDVWQIKDLATVASDGWREKTREIVGQVGLAR